MARISKSSRNKTITLTDEEREGYVSRLISIDRPRTVEDVLDKTILQDIFEVIAHLPEAFVDLVFADPPYNLAKDFNGRSFSQVPLADYEEWLRSWLEPLAHILKPTGTIYICGDWRSSAAIHRVVQDLFIVRNRITWNREKGRGARANWKNSSEDIWFCTVSDEYTFNVQDVKLVRPVIAPYTDNDGNPRDWLETKHGRFRLTHPSNMWTEMTVPFWSMPENTEHPTQKPEKLLAKVILASSKPGDVVFDPFVGSGTTSVVAKKLKRRYVGVDIDEYYCCLTEKRLDMADEQRDIQGYTAGAFWQRNTRDIQEEITVLREEPQDSDGDYSQGRLPL